MKKLSVLILALALLALAGCGKTNVSAPAEESVVIEEIISGLDEAVEESAVESAPAEQSAVESVPAEESAEESATAEETGTQELPAGFEPELESCPICGSASPDRFDLSRGAAVCAGCHPDDAGLRLPITPGVLDAMRYICWCDGKKLFSFRLEGENLKTLSSVTEAYLMMQLEHSFSTLDFYKSLLQYGDII